MSRPGAVVVTAVELRLVLPSGTIPVQAELAYDTSDPYAVTMTLLPPQGPAVRWLVARDVLRDGLEHPAGDGDVRVWPAPPIADEQAEVCLTLASPDGEALLACASNDVRRFLVQTEHVVAPGDEDRFLDVDGLLTALLAG